MSNSVWSELPYEEWKDTCATLHLWTQIVGKVRVAKAPWVNHSWHVTLYVTARGLTTSPIPDGTRTFQIDLDFIDHRARVLTSDGETKEIALEPKSVAAFYEELIEALSKLGVDVEISTKPNEVASPVPFPEDTEHAAYDPEYAHRFWQALVQTDRIFKAFRARFEGKVSPTHFFWGSFDLAVTRFSGRPAPPHPGGIPNLPDWITREAYSHEVSSCGFWPGGEPSPTPVFYSYAYPEPDGFAAEPVKPADAFYSDEMQEFILPYDSVRTARDPDAALLDFLQTTYEAAANRGKWDRSALETKEPWPPRE